MKNSSRFRNSKQNRHSAALENQKELVNLIDSNANYIVRQNAVKQLISINKKHRLKMPSMIKFLVCVKCGRIKDSNSNRTRIKFGQIIQTCNSCNSISRIGGGPKSHRG